MRGRDRLLVIALTLLVVVGGRISWQYYRWHQHAPERAMLIALEADLEDAALGVITTQVASDTLQESIHRADEELIRGRVYLANLERRYSQGRDRSQYLDELSDFNARVNERNRMVEEWRQVVSSNHRYVDRYNQLADSMRSVAERMGEPYYPIRSPAEIATARGMAARGE